MKQEQTKRKKERQREGTNRETEGRKERKKDIDRENERKQTDGGRTERKKNNE